MGYNRQKMLTQFYYHYICRLKDAKNNRGGREGRILIEMFKESDTRTSEIIQ